MAERFSITLLTLFLISQPNLFSQCTNGTEPECQCSTAPVLCTVDELDNYTFSMTSFQHPDDGPSPLCPGANNTTADNPTWFAFTAWCTDLTLDVGISNCTAVGSSVGVQIAIYEDCSYANAVACNVAPSDCNTNNKTLVMTGLTIGANYYFLVDGCMGSYCDVTIDVVGVCGQEEISPWTQGVTGETNPCGGVPETYSVENLIGAATYHWYVDGVEVGTSTTPNLDIIWPTAGTYQLCIDAANAPCIPVTDPPDQLCTTINVFTLDAGTITGPSQLCPNDVANFSVSGYSMGPDYTQVILVANEFGLIWGIINGNSGTYSTTYCETITIYNYVYITATGTVPGLGYNINSLDCSTECCDFVSLTLSFDDTEPPVFSNPPPNESLSCAGTVPMMTDLDWTDNCDGMGTVAGTETGSSNACNGGIITRTWEYTDDCGNTTTHTQTITVVTAPLPAFTNLPADQTVDCDNIPTSAPDLSYTNNASGDCDITGTVSPTQSGTADICGGNISYTWDLTDLCGNTISHTQNITVTHPDAPAFINPPADQSVACANIPTSAPDLNYTNNENGTCLVMGTVSPTQSGSSDECGGTISYIWTFTDICNNTITHIQNYTVDPAPPATFINPPDDVTVTCDNIPTSAPELDYTNNESGNCLIMGTIFPTQSGSADECGGTISYTWTFTDICNNTITHIQNYTVDPTPPAVFIDPPSNITLDCSSVPSILPTLNYTNNQNGACSINGTVTAIQSGFYDACGGNITYTWTFTDDCNRSISHAQNVVVTPASDPMFTSMPTDMTINCGEPFPTPIDLPYTNNESGNCAITGTVPATVTSNGNGGMEYTWTFINPCNNFTITHTQIIDQTPSPDITINPVVVNICEGEMFDLSTITVTDLNNTNPNITFHSGTPATSSNQLTSPIVSPIVSTTYYILAASSFGCSDETSFDVVVEEPPFAGLDGMGEICYDSPNNISLFSYLSGTYTTTGTWVDTYGYGVNLSNPNNISLQGLPAGTYTFDYFVASGGVCPDDVASVTLEFLPEVFIAAFDIVCAADPNFYEVSISNFGFDIIALSGTYTDLGNNMGIVTDIPISQSLVIIATNPSNILCTFTLNISPPDCDCPNVDPPVSDGDAVICEGSPTPQLSVSVGADQSANWYDAPSGGVLLQSGSITYTPSETAIGTYTYYVESEDLTSGCVSSILTPIQFEISENPSGNNAQLEACDLDGDGFTAFDLTEANNNISTNLSYSFTYFESLSNAQNGTGSLSNFYTNTSSPNQTLYVVISNSANCSSIVELTLVVNPPPAITLQINDETCLGDGDGSVTINSSTGVNYSLDNSTWTANNVFDSLISGNYTAYVEDGNGCFASQNFDINLGLEITLSSFETTCNDNGTASDATDDNYNITFTLTNNNGNTGTFSVFDGSLNITSLNYNQSNTISLPAQAQSLTLTFTDEVSNCLITQAVGPLNSCSTDCSISIDQLDFTCSDNGTSNDLTDDFYTVTINTSAINGAANNTYNVLIDGVLNFNYTYSNASTFTILADGSSPIISVVDNQDPQCQATQTIGPLISCSDPCVINFDLVDLICNDNGTITDPSDDFYDINIQASATNAGASNSFEIFANNIFQGTFDYATGGMFTLPADGSSVQILIQDADEPLCSAEQNIGTLEPCNEDCSINATVSNIVCDDNGTGNDDADDTFTFDLLVSGQNIGVSWESTDGTLSGGYGTTQNFGPFSIANGDLNFDLQDLTTLTCMTSISVNAPATCSDPCVINFDLVDVICNDNGTITDPSDDFYEINIQASATNAGASNSFEIFANNISQGTFDYASGGMFTLPADGSAVQILIQDADEPLCSAEQNIGTLEPCNEDCSINATVSNIVCDDNGTGNDDTDDTFTFDLLVSGQNIGTGWQSTDGTISGSYGAVQNFGPFSIANGDLNFDLQDLITLTCETPISIIAPATCSSCPQSVDAGTGSTLTCNNTIANLTGSSSEAGSYVWTGPNSFSSIDLITTTTTPGWYFLTATYFNNCSATDSVFIDIENSTPSANAGPDQFITCDITEVNLVSPGGSGANLEFEWTTSSGVFISNQTQIITSTSGIYNLQLTDSVSGCTSIDQVEVFENTDLPSVVIYADPDNILDCVVSSITLTSDNEPNVIYSWNGIIAPQYVVTEGSIIDLIALDTISGCQNFNQITITDIEDYPFVNLDPPSPISCYEPNTLIDGSNSQLGTNIIYNWYDANNNLIAGQNGNTLLVDNGGFYYLQLTDTLNSCENIDSVFVESLLNVPLAQAVEDVSLFCGETETNLNVNILGSTDDLEITWTTSNGNILSGGTTPNPLVNQSGVYTVSIQDTVSGCVSTDNLEVIINTNVPQLMTANVYDETCFQANDGLIVISNISGGAPPFTYTLNGNPTDNSGQFQNLAPGFYNIILTDANGCTLTDNFTITPGINLELNLPEVIEILEGNSGTIQALVNIPVDSLDYIQWAPPELLSCDTCLTTTIETLDDQTFQLTIIDNNGCIAIAVINVIVIPQVRIYIPNAFSPNFDGHNDYFTLFTNDQVEEILELSIYDRWGEHVFKKRNFQPNDPISGWDGLFKGEKMNPAVFVYIFKVKLKDGSTRVFSGDVTLKK